MLKAFCEQLDKGRYFYNAYAVSLKESKVRPKKYTQESKIRFALTFAPGAKMQMP